MKINGQEINELNEDVLVLPRAKGDIVFKGRAIHTYDDFERICKYPSPPKLLTKRGAIDDTDDPGFMAQVAEYQLRRLAYTAIVTLEPSDIEWQKVEFEKPETWHNWTDELAAVLSVPEQKALLNFIFDVNCLNQHKIEAARANFLAGQSRVTAE